MRGSRPGVQTLGRSESADCVVSKQKRYLQRHPSVDAVTAVEDCPEQIGGLRKILQCQLEEELFSGLALIEFFPDRSIVRTAVFNCVVEDRGIRGEPRNGKLVDIAPEGAAINQVPGNVVEPQTLTQVVK